MNIPTKILSRLLFLCFAFLIHATTAVAILPRGGLATQYNVLKYGAKGDGKTINTLFIQKAIDQCSAKGGGKVVVPKGVFVSGTLYLKDNVQLDLSPGAVLLGSDNLKDYPSNPSPFFAGPNLSLIFANGATNIAITGTGTIDGNGSSPAFEVFDNNPKRPKIVFLIACKGVRVSDITLKNSAFWVQHYLKCENVDINGIKVYSHANLNNDGIDIDSKNVRISNCIIDSDDDALCFKSNTLSPCENVSVSNCVLSSNCNAIKMGTASFGGFKNISVTNCKIIPPKEDKFRQWSTKIAGLSASISTLSGIALEVVDGGVMDKITVSDITMEGVQTPIFIKLGDRERRAGTDGQKVIVGSLSNVTISNVKAISNSLISSSITGFPGYDVKNVVLKDIVFQLPGAGQLRDLSRWVPENEKDYPENRMFGHSLPAYGFYIRHAKDITLENIQLRLAQADARPSLYIETADSIRVKGLNSIGAENNVYARLLGTVNATFIAGEKSRVIRQTDSYGHTEVNFDFKQTKLESVPPLWADLNNNLEKDAYEDTSRSIDTRVKDLLSQMSLDEKVTMIHGSSTFSSGGVPRLGIPPIWMSDGPHGVRLRPEPGQKDLPGAVTYLPTGNTLGATWNAELSYEYGQVLGAEAKFWGKDILLGPGINIIRTPLNGRNFEYLSEDPYLISKLAVGYIKGVQDQGIAASVKHFIANNQEVKRMEMDVHMSDRALREIYLPGFKAAVQEAKVQTVMGAYNKFRTQYCSHNDFLINKVLKTEWGFKGILISDWGAVHDTKEALKNGTDIEMGTPKKYFMDNDLVIPLVKSGVVPVSVIDDKVERILKVMFQNKMFGPRTKAAINEHDNQKVALKVAEEGIVLLKNKNKVLPFDPSRIKTIAVIGSGADYKHHGGGGSSRVPTRYEVTPLQGIRNLLGTSVNITYVQGYKIQKDFSSDSILIEDALRAAKSADAVIFVGGWIHGYGEGMEQEKNPAYDVEARDKHDITLPFGQDQLISKVLKANPKTVVVMMGGGAADMTKWVNQTNALIEAWYPGMEGGTALANIIFGKVNPSGKLPMTFPTKLEDVPAHALGEYPGNLVTLEQEYKDDIYVGYRYYDTYKAEPQFPFGHGLSYTTFKYGDMKVYPNRENVVLSFTLTNTGKREGAEVIQVYVSQEKSELARPAKELKAFNKVYLKPGESKEVQLKINKNDLMYYHDKQRQWVFEPGAYSFLIGSSSRDIRLIQKTTLE
ncbi:glycoside hydrolase family 3 C-terminal domain-containing protein [Arcticibacter sp. MXS-1]|uniref:glycoside hydrolase family 3 C-terminal domain-containing protein n=1 Tax=Arcticibacter sp. MXS-1 TaxID=3341726 RepID=UPI0035A97A01